MHTAKIRRAFVALAVTGALAGLPACTQGSGDAARGGGADGDSKAGRPVDRAVGGLLAALESVERNTDKAESAKVEGTAGIGAMSMTMDGAIDWSNGLTGELSMVQKGGNVPGQVGGGSMKARYTKDGMYVNMGPGFAEKAGGKHWIGYRYKDLAKLSGASGEVLTDQLQHNNPTKTVQLLIASGDVKKVGTETVDGRRTTHYSGTVNVGDLTEGSSKRLSAAKLREFRNQLEKAGLTSEDIDLWVDEDDLLVKKEERADTAKGPFTTTVLYSDYGTDVEVARPAASDTVDFLEMLKKQQAGQ